jgi:Na+-transporting NADH:ubiquinone oxidoreductase subunit C
MKSYSNTYIFIFSTVMVVLVAALLSFVAEKLRPIQERNVEIEKKQDILRSVGRAQLAAEAEDKDTYIEQEYTEYITGSFVLDRNGSVKEGVDAFAVNLKAEQSRDPAEQSLPVYVYTNPDSSKKYIFPLRGKGLWGPIWGYISLDDDFATIYGAVFAHSKETPGLGAEIDQSWFQAQFKGLVIFDEQDNCVSVEVVKGGAPEGAPSAVDAISGGTITSKALERMMYDCLVNYEPYFKSKRPQS